VLANSFILTARNNLPKMTGVKIALCSLGMVTGGSFALTGGILSQFAQIPSVGPETPVNLTIVLIAGGLTTTATLAWKVSRAWSKMETKVEALELQIKHLQKELGED
jgi:hypothetical protein